MSEIGVAYKVKAFCQLLDYFYIYYSMFMLQVCVSHVIVNALSFPFPRRRNAIILCYLLSYQM